MFTTQRTCTVYLIAMWRIQHSLYIMRASLYGRYTMIWWTSINPRVLNFVLSWGSGIWCVTTISPESVYLAGCLRIIPSEELGEVGQTWWRMSWNLWGSVMAAVMIKVRKNNVWSQCMNEQKVNPQVVLVKDVLCVVCGRSFIGFPIKIGKCFICCFCRFSCRMTFDMKQPTANLSLNCFYVCYQHSFNTHKYPKSGYVTKIPKFIGQAILAYSCFFLVTIMPVRSPWTWLTNDIWIIAHCSCHKAKTKKGFFGFVAPELGVTRYQSSALPK